MKRYIAAIMGLILCFIINIGVVNAAGASAKITYVKDDELKTLTMNYPDGKELGIIMLGDYHYTYVTQGVGVYNTWYDENGESGNKSGVEEDVLTSGKMSDHINKNISIDVSGTLKHLTLILDSKTNDPSMQYNVTLKLAPGSEIQGLIVLMTDDNYKVNVSAIDATIGSIQHFNNNKGTLNVEGGKIAPTRTADGYSNASLFINSSFNLNNGSIDLTKQGAKNIVLSGNGTLSIGDKNKEISYSDPKVVLGDNKILTDGDSTSAGSFTLNNGLVESNTRLDTSKISTVSTRKVYENYDSGDRVYRYYVGDKLWEDFIEKFKEVIDANYTEDDGYEVSYTSDADFIEVKIVYSDTTNRDTYMTRFTYANGVISYNNPSGDEDGIVDDLAYCAISALMDLKNFTESKANEILTWVDKNYKTATLARNGIFYEYNSSGKITKFDLDIKNGITMTEGTDEDPTVDKIWSDFTKAYITKITKTLGDNLVSTVVSENTLTVTYKIDKEEGNDINSSIVFTYKDGVVSYKAPSNFAKEYLDDLDPSLIPAIELDSDVKNLLILMAIETLGDMKGYDSKTLLAWLEDAANNYKLSKDGIEVSTFDYEYELEDSVIDVSGKFEVIKSFDLDIKNGLKITKDTEEDDKKSDKDGEIPPAYTGVGVSIITIGALSGGYITIKKKRNILNRL